MPGMGKKRLPGRMKEYEKGKKLALGQTLEELTPDIGGFTPVTLAEGYYSFAVNRHFGGLD